RNLLLGILALQMDFIGRDALIAAMHAWVLDKAKPLGQILQEQGALPPQERALLETLVDRHLRHHGNDPQQSLAALAAPPAVRDERARLADPDVQASLAHAATAPSGRDPVSTIDHTPSGGLRYRVLRPHAKGGLGEVFVAEDTELHREVAFKEIR